MNGSPCHWPILLVGYYLFCLLHAARWIKAWSYALQTNQGLQKRTAGDAAS